MKRIIFILAVTVSLSSCAQKTEKSKRISQEEFAKLPSKDIQLVDVRTPEEYKRGSIAGAILINFYDENFIEQMEAKLDKDKPVYVYCAVGGRSSQATKQLYKKGFKKVFDLQGGYNAWKKKNN